MNEVLQPLAEKLLATGGQPLVEIASHPGNGEVSNVIHSLNAGIGGTALP